MTGLTHVWRPRCELRAIAIGLITRSETLLVSAVTEDDGRVKGWRPLGGGIEFGERGEDALRREIDEEIGATLGPLRNLGTMENLFSHHGAPGHELVMIFNGELLDPGLAAAERFILEDGGFRDQAAWITIDAFLDGHETLLPEGLIDWLGPLDIPGARP